MTTVRIYIGHPRRSKDGFFAALLPSPGDGRKIDLDQAEKMGFAALYPSYR
jgi:hypothetical protein